MKKELAMQSPRPVAPARAERSANLNFGHAVEAAGEVILWGSD
jgi:hypothetical protein